MSTTDDPLAIYRANLAKMAPHELLQEIESLARLPTNPPDGDRIVAKRKATRAEFIARLAVPATWKAQP